MKFFSLSSNFVFDSFSPISKNDLAQDSNCASLVFISVLSFI
ncbi:MAG: hypothetical protein PUC40_09010 [Lachnospiraceae bacterium]|nr:hypothetical protein [Lachnospiraceae bacterium]MDD6550739.1 hypothetical protein [Lachnospiraceae bacterium]